MLFPTSVHEKGCCPLAGKNGDIRFERKNKGASRRPEKGEGDLSTHAKPTRKLATRDEEMGRSVWEGERGGDPVDTMVVRLSETAPLRLMDTIILQFLCINLWRVMCLSFPLHWSKYVYIFFLPYHSSLASPLRQHNTLRHDARLGFSLFLSNSYMIPPSNHAITLSKHPLNPKIVHAGDVHVGCGQLIWADLEARYWHFPYFCSSYCFWIGNYSTPYHSMFYHACFYATALLRLYASVLLTSWCYLLLYGAGYLEQCIRMRKNHSHVVIEVGEDSTSFVSIHKRAKLNNYVDAFFVKYRVQLGRD